MTADENPNPYRSPEWIETLFDQDGPRRSWPAWIGIISTLAALTPVLMVGGMMVAACTGVPSPTPGVLAVIDGAFRISILMALSFGMLGCLFADGRKAAVFGLGLGGIELCVLIALL